MALILGSTDTRRDHDADLQSGSLTLDLAPGRYLLICNLIEDIRFHHKLGMRSPFEVTS